MLTSLSLISTCAFTWEEGGDILRVDGCGGELRPSAKPLYLGNAGTASRFLTTTCALIDAEGQPGTTLTGDPRMKERPIGDLTTALTQIGCARGPRAVLCPYLRAHAAPARAAWRLTCLLLRAARACMRAELSAARRSRALAHDASPKSTPGSLCLPRRACAAREQLLDRAHGVAGLAANRRQGDRPCGRRD